MAQCTSCGAEIVWAKTAAGRTIPLDAEPSEDGNMILGDDGVARFVRLDDRFALKGLRVSHFATCPYAKQHRKR